MIITENDLLAYLGIDVTDDVILLNVKHAIKGADYMIRGAVGTNYPAEDPRVKELALIYAADLYSNRDFMERSGGSAQTNVRRYVEDALLQLRLELRRSTNK